MEREPDALKEVVGQEDVKHVVPPAAEGAVLVVAHAEMGLALLEGALDGPAEGGGETELLERGVFGSVGEGEAQFPIRRFEHDQPFGTDVVLGRVGHAPDLARVKESSDGPLGSLLEDHRREGKGLRQVGDGDGSLGQAQPGRDLPPGARAFGNLPFGSGGQHMQVGADGGEVEAALGKALEELPVHAEGGVAADPFGRKEAGAVEVPDHQACDLGLALEGQILGNAGFLAPLGRVVLEPFLGKIEPGVEEPVALVADIAHEDAGLAVLDLAEPAAILAGDPGRLFAALDLFRGIEREHRSRRIGGSDDRVGDLGPVAGEQDVFVPAVFAHESLEVPNLASAVLGRVLRRLPGDWGKRFGDAPWVVETFVDPSRYKGTSYRAAGFLCLGQTRGFGKTRTKGYAWHGQPKDVYAFVLDPSFRSVVGLSWAPPAPPPSPIRTESWNPSSDVVLPSEADAEIVADELLRFHREFSEGFRTEATRRLGETYLFGLVSDLERKSVEPIAIALLGEKRVRGLQRFMTDRPWDEAWVLELHRRKTAALIASSDPDLSMINADSSEFVKKGTESVGVARQYCGRLGKVENCQSGVFVGYAGPNGHALLAADLYLPRQWLSNDPEDPEREAFRERRKKTGVPDDTPFATKPERALEMIREVRKTGLFPARWVGVDATFGMDREFLRSLPPDLFYFAAIRSNTPVLLSPPRWAVPESKGSRGKKPTKPRLTEAPKKVSDLAETAVFTPTILKEGGQGPLGAHLSCLRIYRVPSEEGEAVSCEWLLLLKTPEGEMKYAFSNAPEDTAPETFARVSTLRWPIEQCFQEGKSFLGMGHYEHRSLRAWKRHMIYVFLAQLFYLRARLALQKKNSRSAFP